MASVTITTTFIPESTMYLCMTYFTWREKVKQEKQIKDKRETRKEKISRLKFISHHWNISDMNVYPTTGNKYFVLELLWEEKQKAAATGSLKRGNKHYQCSVPL